MKMRKRYRPFLLALCLCLSLTACGGPDGDIAGGDWRTTGVVDEPPADDILTEQT